MPDRAPEIDLLKALLTDRDWEDLATVDDDAEPDDFVTVHTEVISHHGWYSRIRVITRGSSGQHYRWMYGEPDDEERDRITPEKFGLVVTPVHPVDEIVTVRKWVADA